MENLRENESECSRHAAVFQEGGAPVTGGEGQDEGALILRAGTQRGQYERALRAALFPAALRETP